RSPAGVWGPITAFDQGCDLAGAAARPPVVAIGRKGALLAAWSETVPGGAPRTFIAERTDDGIWRDPVVVAGAAPHAAVVDQKGRGVVELGSDGSVAPFVELAFVKDGQVRLQHLPDESDVGSLAGNAKGTVVLAVNRRQGGVTGWVDIYAGTTTRL